MAFTDWVSLIPGRAGSRSQVFGRARSMLHTATDYFAFSVLLFCIDCYTSRHKKQADVITLPRKKWCIYTALSAAPIFQALNLEPCQSVQQSQALSVNALTSFSDAAGEIVPEPALVTQALRYSVSDMPR